MIHVSNAGPDWRLVATVEVIEGSPSLDLFFSEIRDRFRFQSAASSPQGCSWFDAYVDFSVGERRAAYVAHALLTALQHVADDGFLQGYRLVAGQQWLIIGDSLHACSSIIEPPGQLQPS